MRLIEPGFKQAAEVPEGVDRQFLFWNDLVGNLLRNNCPLCCVGFAKICQ